MTKYLLSIDQGTTSSRAILFDRAGVPLHSAQHEFTQHFPASGWVEHAPQDLLATVVQSCREVMAEAGCTAADIIAIGIVNQRETTLVWERDGGRPLYNAIVWQDRRTTEHCQVLRRAGCEAEVMQRSGLLLDPYFSASKLAWILDRTAGARRRAAAGELLFGTVDTYLLWHLTGGRVHATDATNAARTLLFNLRDRQWDDALLKLFDIPAAMLPQVRDCAADYGVTDAHWLGGPIPICGVAGDQQAALIGQACFQPGMIKSTYGTGCFMIMNTGATPTFSQHRLLTTLAYQLRGRACYALEGSIFMAGATVQWLRDGLKLIHHASETEALARSVGNQKSVYLVPAFTGLGAPYWDPDARGAIFGLSRDTGIADVVAAGLQAVAYQTRDLVDAMTGDTGQALARLRVDGGMMANDWVAQCLADTLAVPVDRPVVTETTALGAAYLAGLQAGVFGGLDELADKWRLQRQFLPQLAPAEREARYRGWSDAVARVRSAP